ncbi:glycosyl transferase [Pseudomonas fluorescens ABAC62]|nr:glycosyl transferase [Pseudomonas fluorescens ABAC62]
MMSKQSLNTPDLTEQSLSNSQLQGAIIGLYGDVLQGWAQDMSRPSECLVVEVCIDGASVALARADQFRANETAGDPFHGFGVQLRQSWLDSAKHISARVANSDYWLMGELQLPTTPSQEPAPIASQVWHSGGLRLGGWSWDPDAPQRHVQITVREGSQVLGQVTCNTHHQALVYRASSDHGFSFDLPWEMADGKLHTLDIENDLGHPLSGSPITLCCWHDGLEGLLKLHQRAPTEQSMALLTQVAADQSMRLPKSAGFDHYPRWFEAFRPNAPAGEALHDSVGILLISEGDETLEAISLASLNMQPAAPLQVVKTASADVLPALEQLLEAGCEAVIPVMAGDHLSANAIEHLATLLDGGSAWGYADCDRDGPQGERSLPWLKPVWDIDLFIGADIFSPGAIFSAAILDKALALVPANTAQQTLDWDTFIAAIALATEHRNVSVAHFPHVLYHRNGSAPASPENAEPSTQRLRAIAWLAESLEPGACVSQLPNFKSLLRAHWPLPANLPRVSLIVPTRDQLGLLRACIEGLLSATDYPHLEIIVVDNQSSDPNTLVYFKELAERGVQVLPYPHPFNYSAINNFAVAQASGELIGLVNNDIEIIDANWLKEMVSQLLRPGVGAVGAKLLWPNRMVQHGGVVVGVNGLAAHTGNHLQQRDPGYMGLNQLTRRQSAVTAACLLLRRSLFDALDGLDENAFPVAFNDVDLCLRIRQQGLNLIWTPFAELIHAESASRGKDQTPEKYARGQREQQGFIKRWSQSGQSDPYYHPGLSLDYLSGPYGGLAIPPRNEVYVDQHAKILSRDPEPRVANAVIKGMNQ